ncbi:MAG: glycoside hydrolase family 127 protein, partial [Phycisphaerae bacterium]|nr:glycoside hydrolase family 127 protein [Phycisphaerae bacterium]
VSSTWKGGDMVDVKMPFSLRTEGFRDNPKRIAFMNGPLVLCAEVEAGSAERRPSWENYPAIVTGSDRVLSAIKPLPDKPSCFTGSQEIFCTVDKTRSKDITLEPFYQMHGNRHYIVYWDIFTPVQWQAKEKEYKAELARKKELQIQTVDEVDPGEEQNERNHNLQARQSSSGVFSERRWRHATDGGWFSYDVKVLPDKPMGLLVTYWGSDGGNRVFDILVDGTKLAAQRLQNNRPGRFYDEVYPVPELLTMSKNKVTVKFQAHTGAWAGGVYKLRTIKVK